VHIKDPEITQIATMMMTSMVTMIPKIIIMVTMITKIIIMVTMITKIIIQVYIICSFNIFNENIFNEYSIIRYIVDTRITQENPGDNSDNRQNIPGDRQDIPDDRRDNPADDHNSDDCRNNPDDRKYLLTMFLLTIYWMDYFIINWN
jgi:hypothetical protein